MTLKIDAKFEEKLICCFKNDRNLVNFDLSTRSLKNLHFHWFLLCKVFHVWPKKYRGVIFHDTEGWCEIWRNTGLWFGKWHEEFGKLSPEHSKVSKLELWWHPFVQSRKCMRLKFTEELRVMTIKNDTKIQEEMTCRFKFDMRNFANFDLSTQNS